MVFLLIIIYIAFIGLGLPDALLGSAWPVMHTDIGAPLSVAGIISLIVSGGTVVSSLMSGRLVGRFKTGRVTTVSVFMTAAALLGFSFSSKLWQMCLLAVPLGLGAGSVDAALNHFVSLHYKARHMHWLHCFWGVGATLGPVILSFFLAREQGWKTAYRTVFFLQLGLAAVLLFSLPFWKKAETAAESADGTAAVVSIRDAFRLKGIKYALLGFLCYCGYEAVAGLWTASFLVTQRGITPERAALWSSLFYAGIGVGRILGGFIAAKVSARRLIRYGCVIGLCGVAFLFLPGQWALPGIILIGLGGAPFYPQMIHETPRRFGKAASGTAMGLQMACAYVGTTVLPPVVGLLSRPLTLAVFPVVLLLLEIATLFFGEKTFGATRPTLAP
ncbi:MAG: MFS transporter [Clostridiales bacterium]|jgi:fucose permease|nr:MFS transporter [Clostridiales bacterium]